MFEFFCSIVAVYNIYMLKHVFTVYITKIQSKISLYVDLTTADLSWRRMVYTRARTTTTRACCGPDSAGRRLALTPDTHTYPDQTDQTPPRQTLLRQTPPRQTRTRETRPPRLTHLRPNTHDLSVPEIILALQEYCYL